MAYPAKQVKTYLKGTILKLYLHHVNHNELKDSEYLRDLIRKDLTTKYNIHSTGGVVKIPKKL